MNHENQRFFVFLHMKITLKYFQRNCKIILQLLTVIWSLIIKHTISSCGGSKKLQPNKRSIFKDKKDNYPERKLWSVKNEKKIASVLIAANIAIQLKDTLILVIR